MRDETPPSKLGKSRAEKSNKQSNTEERGEHITVVAPNVGRFPMVKVFENGAIGMVWEPTLKKALGTTNGYFVQGIISQLARLNLDGRIDEDQLNFMLCIIKE